MDKIAHHNLYVDLLDLVGTGDPGVKLAMVKVAKKGGGKPYQMSVGDGVLTALFGPLAAFGAPKGRKLRTAGHVLGKSMLGGMAGGGIDALVAAATKGKATGVGKGLGSLLGGLEGFRTGAEGKKFWSRDTKPRKIKWTQDDRI